MDRGASARTFSGSFLGRSGSSMEEHGAQPASRIAFGFIVAGILAGIAAFPVLHFLNDHYRFEPTGQMSSNQAEIEKEQNARSRGDFLSNALQGALLAAAFGVCFGIAGGFHSGSLGRGLLSAVVGSGVGAALATFGRQAVRDFSLYCISNDVRGLHVSVALQALVWIGSIAGAALAMLVAMGFDRRGWTLAGCALASGLVGCLLAPVLGQIAFPVDYSDRIAENLGQSALTAVTVGTVVGIGTAFAAMPGTKESSI